MKLLPVTLVNCAAVSSFALTVHTTDFIPDGTRTRFVGFEGMQQIDNSPRIENGIKVEQVNGDPNPDIWTTYFHPEGSHGWYPNGGDNGYTRIMTIDGSPFGDFGLFRSSGNSMHHTLAYELWNDGSLLHSGSVTHDQSGAYLGFSGAVFDEVLLRDSRFGLTARGGGHNALAIDAIETSGGAPVPEVASSLALFTIGIAGVGLFRRKLA